eukprot:1011497_1
MSHSTIMIDNGSDTIKTGFAGDDTPRTTFTSVVGGLRNQGVNVAIGVPDKHVYVGDEAMKKRTGGILSLRYPIERGIVTSWDDMEKIWHYTFYNKLRIQPQEHHVLLSEPPNNPKTNREKTIEIMFEKFNVPAAYLAMSSVLSLFASGRYTGIVLDSGDQLTTTVPIYEGSALPHAIHTLEIGGKDLTLYLIKQINAKKKMLYYPGSDEYIARDIKKKLCYTPLNYNDELKASQRGNSIDRHYLLHADKINTNKERFSVTEAMFAPHLLNQSTDGIDKMLYESVMKCDANLHDILFSNIVLSGGNMLFPGMDDRLRDAVVELITSGTKERKVHVVNCNRNKQKVVNAYLAKCGQNIDSKITQLIYQNYNDPSTDGLNTVYLPESERQYSVWRGGSILSALYQGNGDEFWISKNSYEEYGPDIVHRKCF